MAARQEELAWLKGQLGDVEKKIEAKEAELKQARDEEKPDIRDAIKRLVEKERYWQLLLQQQLSALQQQLSIPAGTELSLDDFLKHPLPAIRVSGSSNSVMHSDSDRRKHPTEVLQWPSFLSEVRDCLQWPEVQAWRTRTYPNFGNIGRFETAYRITNEQNAVSVLWSTACLRLNIVFEENQFEYRFTGTPSTLMHDSQEPEPGQPQKLSHGDAPDICLEQEKGFIQDLLTIECKTKYQLKDVEKHHLADVWSYWKDSRSALSDLKKPAAYNAVAVISQEFAYMAKRGHMCGVISTFETTWVLKSNGKGTVWVSDKIPNTAVGSDTQVSVTQALLFAALSNLRSNMAAYPTAREPGGLPVDPPKRRTRSLAKRSAEQAGMEGAGQSSSQQRPQPSSPAASVPVEDLHLTTRLSSAVYMGRVAGMPAAVRVATDDAAEEAAMREVAAYKRLEDLQGVHVPRLLAYGDTETHIGTAFYVATEFVEGKHWDTSLGRRRDLDKALLDVLAAIHSRGVGHGDLHGGNILVTPEGRIVIVDFEGAELQAPATATNAEMQDLSRRLQWPVEAH